jgi:hypothetical protein
LCYCPFKCVNKNMRKHEYAGKNRRKREHIDKNRRKHKCMYYTKNKLLCGLKQTTEWCALPRLVSPVLVIVFSLKFSFLRFSKEPIKLRAFFKSLLSLLSRPMLIFHCTCKQPSICHHQNNFPFLFCFPVYFQFFSFLFLLLPPSTACFIHACWLGAPW